MKNKMPLLEKIERGLLIFSSSFLLFLLWGRFLLRNLFEQDWAVNISEEIQKFLLPFTLWIALLGGAYSLLKKEMIQITLIIRKYPPGVKKGISYGIYLLSFLLLVGYGYLSYEVYTLLQDPWILWGFLPLWILMGIHAIFLILSPP